MTNKTTPLDLATLDQKIALYALEEGDPCAEVLAGLAIIMQVVYDACRDKRRHSGDLKHCLSICVDQILQNRFSVSTCPVILRGLELCLELSPKLGKRAIAKAWQRAAERGVSKAPEGDLR